MSKIETSEERMVRLYKEYNLDKEDVFSHRHYKIITRSGIDKIQAAAKIDVTYELVYTEFGPDGLYVGIKATGVRGEKKIETYGEAAPNNTTQNYPFAMAEKRAMARVVLKLAGLYELGFFSEDEADDFGKVVKAGRKTAVYKGE
jgi:hypothetical protein